MKRYITYILLFTIQSVLSQSDTIDGVVTFNTSKNTYVRFSSTEKISIGDTLYLTPAGAQACLLILKKSSTSCVCQSINDCKIEKDTRVFFRLKNQPIIPSTITSQMDRMRTFIER